MLYKDGAAPIDGIRDYAEQLVASVRCDHGREADLLLCAWRTAFTRRVRPHPLGSSQFSALPDSDAPSSILLVQYNPFSYGRWGVAPWLPLTVLRMRRRLKAARVGLMVHEAYVPFPPSRIRNWRSTVMATWQRLQLFALLAAAEVVFVSTEVVAAQLARKFPFRPTHHLPVGSNLPDMRGSRPLTRRRLGVDAETFVLATLGIGRHPSRISRYVTDAANAIVESGQRVLVLNLGSGAPPPQGLDPRIDVETPGELDRQGLAEHLSAADLFVAPFVEGVSTRRTSVMAALQHELPVIGTEGEFTDSIFRRSSDAVELVPEGRPDAFAETARRLASDDNARRTLATAGRALYERAFDWPVISEKLIRALSPDTRV